MAVTPAALPPGVLSVHALPADHHDGPWDHIITADGVKDRLLNHALLTLLHGPALGTLAGLPHGLIILAGSPRRQRARWPGGVRPPMSRSTRMRFRRSCWGRASAT
ncbi:hypothetical protein [Mycolicibacterium wolinskyi]|uniref:hypothetical protein n=1 Tax=Mycolicibacterium wolinskyi TaxID=59750 RepID=UPI0018E310A1|nr:hypothetical protein [Mycolicibacterium wolinskyi]